MHLLFVEDDEALAYVIKRALERRGFSVHWFGELREARVKQVELPLDYALLDLKVGKETSLDFIAQVKQSHPDIPIVLLTGYGSIATAVQAMKLGAMNYLTKPCSIEHIVAALNNKTPSAASDDSVEVETPSLRRAEWEIIQKALDENQGNISATARQLKMHRRTLQRKLQKRPSAD